MTPPTPGAVARPGRGIPSRHIHVDFHTSPEVRDVGRDFDQERFGSALADASVSSITVFAKCHHGMAYYPTDVGVQHPGLNRDLLGEQIEAAHRRGIRVAAYFSVMYDQHIWSDNAGWRVLDRSGLPRGLTRPAAPVLGELGKLCLNTPYLDYVTEMAREVVGRYDVDGIFFDNVQYGRGLSEASVCYCQNCVSQRRAGGIDPDDTPSNLRHMADMIDGALERMFASVLDTRPDASVFVNGQLVMNSPAWYLDKVSPRYRHLEIESLPGGDWGYGHFPLAVRRMRQFDLELIGMTGAFHRSWGDFGSVRSEAATAFECASMLAQGAAVSVGDHMHPHGNLNPVTYGRIGGVYAKVKALEPWTGDSHPIVDIGVIIDATTVESAAVRGAAAMLTQLRQQFDLVDADADLTRYRLLIVPESMPVDAGLGVALQDSISAGGAVMATGGSLGPDAEESTLQLFGVSSIGSWEHEHQYLQLLADGVDHDPSSVDIVYIPGEVPTAGNGGEVLAHYWQPFFAHNSYEHFQVAQVPPEKSTDLAAIVATPRTAYLAPPLFTDYATHAFARHREIVANVLDRLLPCPLVRADGPSTLQVTVTAQPTHLLVHALHYVPQTRARGVEIVEDEIPLYDVRMQVRVGDSVPESVKIVPSEQPLEFEVRGGYAHFVVPTVEGHTVIALSMPDRDR